MSKSHHAKIPANYQHPQDKTVFHARSLSDIALAFQYAARAVIIDTPVPDFVAIAAHEDSQRFGSGHRRLEVEGRTDFSMARRLRNAGISHEVIAHVFTQAEALYAAIHPDYQKRKFLEQRRFGLTTVEGKPNWHIDDAGTPCNVYIQPLLGAGTRLATYEAEMAFGVQNLSNFVMGKDRKAAAVLAAEAALGPTAIEVKPGQSLLLNLAHGLFPPPVQQAIHAAPHDDMIGHTSPHRLAVVIDIPASLRR
ncbi:MAG: hypothetical protein V4621_00450 [Pseudomonadota bacterium]